MFRQLSFDSSNSDVHIALVDEQTVVSQHVVLVADASSGTSRQEAANLLIPGIDRMLNDVGWTKKDIDCLIVGTGPGGFTGIRTSVVTARALAQAMFLPLYPVSILETRSVVLPGTFVVIQYATTGQYFMAKGTASGVEAAYVKQSDVASFVGDIATIYVDERARAEISGHEQPVQFQSSTEINDLPRIENIAAQQASFAWQGLSLKIRGFYEKLGALSTPSGTPSETLQQKLRLELMQQFPYELVVPTYLRAPSVTLKKNV